MSALLPTYGGAPIFGVAVRMQHIAEPCATQIESFFGVPGAFSVFGGTRSRVFQVEGCLFDFDIPSLNADEQIFTPGAPGSMADGIARDLFDSRGRTWNNVIFVGEFQPDPMGPKPAVFNGGSGYILPYKAVFHGLT